MCYTSKESYYMNLLVYVLLIPFLLSVIHVGLVWSLDNSVGVLQEWLYYTLSCPESLMEDIRTCITPESPRVFVMVVK
jgi:hypothetical protein